MCLIFKSDQYFRIDEINYKPNCNPCEEAFNSIQNIYMISASHLWKKFPIYGAFWYKINFHLLFLSTYYPIIG